MIQSKNRQKINIIDLIQWILVIGVFFYNRVEILTLFIAFSLFVAKKKKLLRTKLILPLIALFVFSTILTIINGYSLKRPILQFVIIAFFVLVYEQFLRRRDFQVKELFRKYLIVSYYFALIGLIQFVVCLITNVNFIQYIDINSIFGMPSMYVLNGRFIRVTSLCLEGGYLGTYLTPTIVYSLYYKDPMKLFSRSKIAVIVLCGLLTYSPFVYISLLAIIWLKLSRKFKKLKYVIIIGGVLGALIYISTSLQEKEIQAESSGINGIFMRIRDSYTAFTQIENPEIIFTLNTSTAVLASNLYSAINAPSRLFGTGIGTNPENFTRAFKDYNDSSAAFLSLNLEDAYSLGIRLFSELGVVGLIVFLLFLKKHYNKENYINVCALSLICCYLCRGGSFVSYGTIMFLFIIYRTSKFNLYAKNHINHHRNVQCRKDSEQVSGEHRVAEDRRD